MAIEFNCPHCAHSYRLKDELAGKTATCKTCRNKIVIPQPVTIPDDKPTQLSAEELAAKEAEAIAALADEKAKVEEDEAAKLIPVKCPHCDHEWTEPIARAGKNTLCPSPECRQRIKIPEPKDMNAQDWRVKNTKLPSMAKDANKKLEDVQDAGDAKMVGLEAMVQAGAIEVELEPRSLKRMAMFGMLVIGVLAGTTFGIRSGCRGRVERGEERLILEAQAEFAKGPGALPASEAPPEVALCSALLFMAGGEHSVRYNDDTKKLRDAQKQFADARDAIRKAPPSPARNAVAGELAVALLALGGNEQQSRDQFRIRWAPDTKLKVRPNERVYTVLEELRQTLAIVQGEKDFEFKNHLARRLTRELVKREQAGLAVELIPVALFTQQEQDEGKAIVALEVLRADKGSDLPRKVADDLKSRGAELVKGVPTPASAQTLFIALGDDKMRVVSPPAANPVSDPSRLAYVGKFLLDNQPEEALKLAQRPGTPEGQVRAIVLCADWAADPTAALDAAIGIVIVHQKKKELSPYSVLRLAQIAAEKGKHDQAKEFAKLVADDGLKVWAHGSTLQLRIALAPKEKADETWAELPTSDKLPKEFRAGHAWGRMWVARQNAKLSGDRSGEVKAVSEWPTLAVLFGKAGIALGLQDK